MSDPIILDGGAQRITITLPSSFTQISPTEFVVEVPDGEEAFESIVVRDEGELREDRRQKFRQDGLTKNWSVRMERAEQKPTAAG